MMGSAAAADLPEGDAGRGKMIYEQVCAYCHRLDYDEKFAPGLQGITERVSLEWLDTWLKNPNALIAKDEYAKALHDSNEYGMAMPPIPDMKDDQKRADIIEFLKTLQ
jgi:Cytochrome c2